MAPTYDAVFIVGGKERQGTVVTKTDSIDGDVIAKCDFPMDVKSNRTRTVDAFGPSEKAALDNLVQNSKDTIQIGKQVSPEPHLDPPQL